MFRCLKIKNLRLIAAALGCLLIIAVVSLLSLRGIPPKTVKLDGEDVGLHIDSDADIEAFIDACGRQVEGCVTDEEITVPKTWNETYEAYNELQRRQGFDLRPYKGKQVRRLVYAAAGEEETVTVLVSDDRIIAAEVCCARYGSEPEPLVNNEK